MCLLKVEPVRLNYKLLFMCCCCCCSSIFDEHCLSHFQCNELILRLQIPFRIDAFCHFANDTLRIESWRCYMQKNFMHYKIETFYSSTIQMYTDTQACIQTYTCCLNDFTFFSIRCFFFVCVCVCVRACNLRYTLYLDVNCKII